MPKVTKSIPLKLSGVQHWKSISKMSLCPQFRNRFIGTSIWPTNTTSIPLQINRVQNYKIDSTETVFGPDYKTDSSKTKLCPKVKGKFLGNSIRSNIAKLFKLCPTLQNWFLGNYNLAEITKWIPLKRNRVHNYKPNPPSLCSVQNYNINSSKIK